MTTHDEFWPNKPWGPNELYTDVTVDTCFFQRRSSSLELILEGSFYQRDYKSDNLLYNTMGLWVDCLINQASNGPNIIMID